MSTAVATRSTNGLGAVTAAAPDLPRWGRLAMAATGIVGSAIFLWLAFSPNLPMYGDSSTDYARWAHAHQADARRVVGLLFLTFALYLVFGVFVSTIVKGAHPWSGLMAQIALVALGVRFAIELVQVSILTIPTTASTRDFTASMADLGQVVSVTSLAPHAVFLAAVGAAAMISRTVPSWLAWVTLGVAALHGWALMAGAVGIPMGPIGEVFGFLWFLSIPGWPLLAGGTLIVLGLPRTSRTDNP